MAQGTSFWNRMSARYIATPIKDTATYERKIALTQAWFTPDTQVLEFGSGSGATALRHAPHVRDILAIDYSTRMVAAAQAARQQTRSPMSRSMSPASRISPRTSTSMPWLACRSSISWSTVRLF